MKNSLIKKVKIVMDEIATTKSREGDVLLRNQASLMKGLYEQIKVGQKILDSNSGILEGQNKSIKHNENLLSEQLDTLSTMAKDVKHQSRSIVQNETQIDELISDISLGDKETKSYLERLSTTDEKLNLQLKKIEDLSTDLEKKSAKFIEAKSSFEIVHQQYVRAQAKELSQKAAIDRNKFNIEHYEQQINTRSSQAAILQTKCSENSNKIKEQQVVLADKDDQYQNLRSELSVLGHHLKSQRAIISVNNDKIQDQIDKSDKNEKELQRLKQLLDESKSKLDVQQLSIKDNASKIHKQEEQISKDTVLMDEQLHGVQRNKEIIVEQDKSIRNNLKKLNSISEMIKNESLELNMQRISIANNEKEIDKSRGSIAAGEEKLIKLREQIHEGERLLIEQRHSIKRYKEEDTILDTEVSLKERQLEDHNLSVSERELEVKVLEAKVHQSKALLSELEDKVLSYLQRTELQEREHKELKKLYAEQEASIEDKSVKLKNLYKIFENNEVDLKNASGNIQDKQIQLVGFNRQIDELEAKISKQTLQIYMKTNCHGEQSEQILEASEKIAMLLNDIDLNQLELEQLNLSIDDDQKNLEMLNEEIESYNKELIGLMDSIVKKRSSFEDQEKKLEDGKSFLLNQNKLLQSNERELEQLNCLRSDYTVLLSEQEKSLKDNADIEHEQIRLISERKTEVSKLSREIESESKDLIKVYAIIDENEKEIISLEGSFAESKEQLAGLVDIKELLYKQIEDQESQICKLHENLSSKQDSIKEEKGVILSLEKRLEAPPIPVIKTFADKCFIKLPNVRFEFDTSRVAISSCAIEDSIMELISSIGTSVGVAIKFDIRNDLFVADVVISGISHLSDNELKSKVIPTWNTLKNSHEYNVGIRFNLFKQGDLVSRFKVSLTTDTKNCTQQLSDIALAI